VQGKSSGELVFVRGRVSDLGGKQCFGDDSTAM
jgi:hypothetical protein